VMTAISAISRFIFRRPTAPVSFFILTVLVFTLSVAAAQTPRAPQISTSAAELVFAGVINRSTIPTQPITITNTGNQTLTINKITKQTANTGAFILLNPPSSPVNINPGQNIIINVRFVPGTSVGRLTTNIVIDAENAVDVTVPVFGLSAVGLEGSNEPTLGNVVHVLGYHVNVGFTGLTSDTDNFPIGDEVIQPLFVKAVGGVVTLRPVGRYSPERAIEYGYYFPSGSNPIRTEIAIISDTVSETVQYPPNHQTLNPVIDPGGSLTFDPGSAAFGVFVEGLSDRLTYTEDSLNGSGPVDHAVRIYPLKNRNGVLVPNSYLVCFEDAENGDYQDYMFVISNVRDPNAPAPTHTPTSTHTSTETPDDPPTLTVLTQTPAPTDGPTTTPALPEPATDTPNPGTPGPQRDIELLTNSSFEIDFNADNLPDAWSVKNLSSDKLKCDKPEKNKFFAHTGGCAFMLRPGTPEMTKLVQKPDVSPINEASLGRLLLSAYTQAPVAPGMRIKVVVAYIDPTLAKDKFTFEVPASTSYIQLLQNVITLVEPDVAKVKIVISNEITQGKVFVDDVSLLWQTGPIGNPAPAVLPLP
jgi:hypothetical protein